MAATANRDARSWDDELFTKVLSSAYSLQQQHDRIQSKLPAARFSEILAEVINTQALIRDRKLDPDTAMHLIASRTEKLSGAAGAAVALLDGELLDYKVGTGIATSLSGFKNRAQEIISFERLKFEPLAETDTWQEKVLGGRVVANVLSAPVYRQNTLAGCIQLFSRHGHFDLDGRYVCELMSGVISHVIEKIPASQPEQVPQASRGKLEPTLPFDRASRSDAEIQTAASRAKLEWPSSSTRELEARLKKAVMSVNGADQPAKASPGDARKFPVGAARSPERGSDQWEDEAKPTSLEKPRFGNKDEAKDKNPQILSRAPHGASPSVGSLALVPTENHAPRLISNPKTVEDTDPLDESPEEPRWREASRDFPAVTLADEQPEVNSSSGAANGEADVTGGKTWSLVRRMIYPVFVLLFAITVRIRAGAHNWPLEVIIYILLVLTTLELQSRWSKR